MNTQNQIKVKIIQKIKTQNLQFALRSLYNSQKKNQKVIIKASRKILI